MGRAVQVDGADSEARVDFPASLAKSLRNNESVGGEDAVNHKPSPNLRVKINRAQSPIPVGLETQQIRLMPTPLSLAHRQSKVARKMRVRRKIRGVLSSIHFSMKGRQQIGRLKLSLLKTQPRRS